MKGFRKINGVNWINEKVKIKIVNAKLNSVYCEAVGKLPAHWNDVKNVLLSKSN